MFRDKTQEHRLSEELGHVSHAEAPHQIKPVDFNRPDADIELFADFPIRVPLGHEAQNFLLTGSQRENFSGFFFRIAFVLSRHGLDFGHQKPTRVFRHCLRRLKWS